MSEELSPFRRVQQYTNAMNLAGHCEYDNCMQWAVALWATEDNRGVQVCSAHDYVMEQGKWPENIRRF